MEHTVIGTSKAGVSIFWWVFWLLVFWPMLALIALIVRQFITSNIKKKMEKLLLKR